MAKDRTNVGLDEYRALHPSDGVSRWSPSARPSGNLEERMEQLEPKMSDAIELISDGDGMAVIGDPRAVDLFLSSHRFESRELGLPRLGQVLSAASGVAHAGSAIAANSGRWVQLTQQSAEAMSKFTLMTGSTPGVSRAVFTQNGKITSLMEIVQPGVGMLTNPAVLAGAAGIMAQLAMQQAMDEITDYLAVIDEKVDDILRAQKDAVLADMIVVGLVIDEAMTIRQEVGHVSDVTWSKVQATSFTIARTQAYALRQLDALAEKMESKRDIGELRATFKVAEETVQEWLAVLARCFQLQDAVSILELDRVLEASPDELNGHRLGVKAARQKRLELIARTTTQLMVRMDAAAGFADTKVLLNPFDAPAVVRSSNQLGGAVGDFNTRLGLESGGTLRDRTRWVDAAVSARDKAVETGTEGVDVARRFGAETLDKAKSATDKLGDEIAKRVPRRKD
jgi:hypothetical protein